MSELIEKVVASLEQDADFEQIEDSICTAADVLCRSVNNEYRSGFPEIDSQEIGSEESQALEQALVELINRSNDVRIKTSAIWALGKSNNPHYKDIYVEYLKESLQQLLVYNKAVFETLSTLRQIDPETFIKQEKEDAANNSQEATTVDKEIRQAHQYLLAQNIYVA
ncbi:MAG: hypothetical protein ACFBSE_12250 [Prochloraceae cyanobacterium]